VPSLHQVYPMPQQSDPVTTSSVAAALAYRAEQRLAMGFDPDVDAEPITVGPAVVLHFEALQRPIPSRTLPMERQLDLNDSVDALVEEYGLAQVIRTVKMIASINGIDLV
jgi:hypothetical protein